MLRDSFYRMVMLALLSTIDQKKWGRFDAARLSNLGYYYSHGDKRISEWQFRYGHDVGFYIGWLYTFGAHAPSGTKQPIYTKLAKALIEALKTELNITDIEEFVAPIQEPSPVYYPRTWRDVRKNYLVGSFQPEQGDLVLAHRVIYDFDESTWLLLLTRQGHVHRLNLDGTNSLMVEITPPPEGVEVHLSSNGKFAVYVAIQPADETRFTKAEMIVWDLWAKKEFARTDPPLQMRTAQHQKMSVADVDCGNMYQQSFLLSAACSASVATGLDSGTLHTWSLNEQTRQLTLLGSGGSGEYVLGSTLRRGFMHITPMCNLSKDEPSLFILVTGEIVRAASYLPVSHHLLPKVFDYREDGRILVCSWRDDVYARQVSVLGAKSREWHTIFRRPYLGPGIVAGALHPFLNLAIVVSQGCDVDLVGPEGAQPLFAHTQNDRSGNLLLRVLYVGFTPDGRTVEMVIRHDRSIEVLKIPM